MFGLDIDTMQATKAAFSRFPRIQKALIYGSRAKGNYKRGSDIDITLIGKGLTSQNTVYPLMQKLDELYLPYKFDISIFNQLNNTDIIKHILRVGKIFYRKEGKGAEGWATRMLGELCQIELGRTPARNNPNLWDTKKTTDNVWLSIADLPKTLKACVSESKEYISDEAIVKGRLAPKGTLLVSFKLTLGRLAFAGRDLYTNEAIASLTILNKKVIAKDYLYWYLTYFDWNKIARGEEKIKGKTLNKKKLNALPVILPPLPEQKRIVAILDEAFAAIATATANTEKNLANARELFNSQLEQALTGDAVNDGWGQTNIEEVCDILDRIRKPITKKDRVEGPYPYYGATGILDHVAGYLFDEPLVLVGEDGAKWGAGENSAFAIEGKCWVNNHAHVLRPRREVVLDAWIIYFLNHSDLTPFITGLTVPKLNQSKLKEIPIPLPPLPEQKRIVALIDKVAENSTALARIGKQKLAHFADLKQSLLHQAFTGELSADHTADRALSEGGV